MESIKHKMECLVKEKDEAVQRAEEAEKIGAEFGAEATRYEKESFLYLASFVITWISFYSSSPT